MVNRLSATELRTRLKSREISTVEVAMAHLDAIDVQDSQLNAYLDVFRDIAIESAELAQQLIDSGQDGPLTGIPIAIKDNINVSGKRTTCASKMLEAFVAPFDAHVTQRLRDSGMVMLGKTNLDEFAMGVSTLYSAIGPTKNPWDESRTPGGSSGGSAAAVAAGMATLALGSDTGGSIRQPASLCGIVGFKPTYGRCSRYGLVAFASSLDQIGPFARNVEDAALCASAITGHDQMDSTSLDTPPIDISHLKSGRLKGKRIGLPKEMFGEGIEPGVLASVRVAIEKLSAEGVEFEEISLPSTKFGVTTYYVIAPAEASSNLARFDGVRYGHRAEGSGHIGTTERSRAEGFGHEVKARIMIGTYALSAGYYDAYYVKAQQVRAMMSREYLEAFQRFDAVLNPTSPIVAFRYGELDDPLALKQLDFCTLPANMGGFPSISIPCGLSERLPVGLQLTGPTMGDESILQLAWSIEQTLGVTLEPPIA